LLEYEAPPLRQRRIRLSTVAFASCGVFSFLFLVDSAVTVVPAARAGHNRECAVLALAAILSLVVGLVSVARRIWKRAA
jgi:hypothetical protein